MAVSFPAGDDSVPFAGHGKGGTGRRFIGGSVRSFGAPPPALFSAAPPPASASAAGASLFLLSSSSHPANAAHDNATARLIPHRQSAFRNAVFMLQPFRDVVRPTAVYIPVPRLRASAILTVLQAKTPGNTGSWLGAVRGLPGRRFGLGVLDGKAGVERGSFNQVGNINFLVREVGEALMAGPKPMTGMPNMPQMDTPLVLKTQLETTGSSPKAFLNAVTALVTCGSFFQCARWGNTSWWDRSARPSSARRIPARG